ncbi:MAG TPA: PEGA domain-containing protein [bacterium]|nr:PEGA domain-containing protein [bacterium]
MRRILSVVFALSAIAASALDFSAMPVISVETASLGGQASLSVRSDVRNASVWLDNQVRGTVPLDLTGLTPGYHALVLHREGYYDAIIQLSLAADTHTTVTTSLVLKTGFLSVSVSPANAQVLVDDNAYAPGTIEVPAGQRRVLIKAFGYREQELSVYVPERLFASISVALDPAPFEATSFSLSANRFNPRNAGLRGSARLSFHVSAPGSADITIRAADSTELVRTSMSPFTDWNQEFDWNGLADDGTPVPDGTYTIGIVATPAPGIQSAEDSYAYEAQVTVDSTMILSPSGAFGALPGSFYAPSAFAPAFDGFRIEASGYALAPIPANGAAATGIITMGAMLSLHDLLEAGLALETTTTDSSAAAIAGLRIAAPVPGPVGLSGVIDGRLSYATAGDPAWVRLGPAIGLGSAFVNVVIAPTIGAYWEDGFSARGGLGAAVSIGGYAVSAALSAYASTGPLAGGWSIATPVRSALELRFTPAGIPLSFRVFGGLDWSPLPSAWMAGVAIAGEF